MNERIRELAEQAGYKPLPGFDFANSLEETYLKKFAELLIRECAVWMENVTVTDSAGNKDYIGDSFFWADELKKHFGVK